MAIAKYKYAAETVKETPGRTIDPGDIYSVSKSLEGSAGVLFHVMCLYQGAAARGLTVRVVQSIGPGVPSENPEIAPISFDMPLTGSETYATIPVLLPEIGPQVTLQLENNTGDSAWVTVWSRMIEGIEIS